MIWIAAVFVVFSFIALAHVLAIPKRAGAVLGRSRNAVRDLRNAELSDLEKEVAMRNHATNLFVQFLIITLSAALALALPVGLIALLDQWGVVSLDETLEATMSWQILVGATIVGLLIWRIRGGEKG